MLLIGEAVLSLLIVETSVSAGYYVIAIFGVLTVVLLEVLKFETEPSHAEGHALWRSLRSAMLYGLLIQVLSMALIAYGVSYKLFLKAVVKYDKQAGYEDNTNNRDRMLAPVPDVADEASAALFSSSLSIVLISLELMLLTHNGVKQAYGHLLWKRPGHGGNRALNWTMIVITAFKLCVLLFTLTLSLWEDDPTVLTFCGFAIMTIMTITRLLGWTVVEDPEEPSEVVGIDAQGGEKSTVVKNRD